MRTWRTVLWCGWLLVAGVVEGAFTNTNALIIRPKIQVGRPGGPMGAWAVSLPPQVGVELTITVVKARAG